MSISLESTIEAQTEYRLGEPINITGTLLNTGQTGVWVLKWNTFLDGMRGNFARLRLKGAPLPYEGVLLRRGNPRNEQYVLIPPGESVAATVELSSAYPISQPGEYEASFVLHIHDAFEAGLEDPPRPLNTHEPVEVASPVTSFRVIAGGEPLPTLGERARKQSIKAAPEAAEGVVPAPPKNPRVPVIIGADSEQTKAIQDAYNWAYESMNDSYKALQFESIATNSDYTEWFGTYSSANGLIVSANFQKAINLAATQTLTFNLTDPYEECSSDTFAYIIVGGGNTIYICSLFFSWFWSSDEEQAQTIIHELTHITGGTDDIAYGEWACANLAESNPSQAIQNADSYGYFAMDVNPESPPSNNGVWTKDTPLSGSTRSKPSAAVSTSAGSLLLSWQDSDQSKKWLWYAEWNVAQNSWGKSNRIYYADTQLNCVTAAGPALAAVGDFYYLLFIDGNPKSPTYNYLIYVTTSDNGVHWTQPVKIVDGVDPTKSPAMVAGDNGTLYCLYVGSDGYLYGFSGAPNDEVVNWGPPATQSIQSDIEPCLGLYLNTLYCMYTRGSQVIQVMTSTNGVAWTQAGPLPDSQTAAAGAIVQWNSPITANPLLMCLYRGPGSDLNLHYTIYDGNVWTYQFRESSNASAAGPALASYGSILYSFHGGARSTKMYWSHTNPPQNDE